MEYTGTDEQTKFTDGMFELLIQCKLVKENVHYKKEGIGTVWNDHLHSVISDAALSIIEAIDDSLIYDVDEYGTCKFTVDGHEFEVLMTGCMHRDTHGLPHTSDVAILACYHDEDGMNFHLVPDGWVHCSEYNEFDAGKPVHKCLLEAAKKYVKDVWGE